MKIFTENIQKIFEIAASIYGPERVDLVTHNMRNGKVKGQLTIHFPELTLTNSRNNSHPIKDLYVQLDCTPTTGDDDGYLVWIGFNGIRTTYSLQELDQSFMHSHLSPTIGMTDFCLGDSTFGEILDNVRIEDSEELWELLLYSIPGFVSWESLEGGPYRLIAEIKYTDAVTRMLRGRSERVSQEKFEDTVLNIIPHIPRSVWQFNPEMSLIPDHPDFIDFLNKYFPIRTLEVNNSTLSTEFKNYFERRQREVDSMGNAINFKFKGKKVDFKLYDNHILNEKAIESNHVSPNVISDVIKIINLKLLTFTKITYNEQKNFLPKREKFREISAFKQANLNYYTKTETADRLPA